ncbi:MAG: hypothetical protein AAFW81_12955, partial [Pseudomonadota bacterium]
MDHNRPCRHRSDAPPAPPPRHTEDGPSYGPPPGTEQVPEWKAALYSAELGDDQAAAERIKEESYVGPVPEEPPAEGEAEPAPQ